MNANEIRQKASTANWGAALPDEGMLALLAEIAAQLAELNETLRKAPVMGLPHE